MQAVDMNTAGIAPPTVEKMSREDIYLSFRLGPTTAWLLFFSCNAVGGTSVAAAPLGAPNAGSSSMSASHTSRPLGEDVWKPRVKKHEVEGVHFKGNTPELR